MIARRTRGAEILDAAGAVLAEEPGWSVEPDELASDPLQRLRRLGMLEDGTSGCEPLDLSGMTEIDLAMLNHGIISGLAKQDDGTETDSNVLRLRREASLRGYCHRFSETGWFKCMFACLIVVCTIIDAFKANGDVYEYEHPGRDATGTLTAVVDVVDHILNVSFLLELVIRILGSPVRVWKDQWLVLDGLIVFFVVVDAWVIEPMRSQTALSSLTVFRGFRVFRALRAARTLRLLRFMKPFRVLAGALSQAFRRIVWIVFVVWIFVWSVAVVLTGTLGAYAEADAEAAELSEYLSSPPAMFKTVATSCVTSTLMLLGGLDWGHRLVTPLLSSNDAGDFSMGLFILMFLCFCKLCLANLIGGLFVSNIMEAARQDEHMVRNDWVTSRSEALHKLRGVFKDIDADDSGTLTREEFERGLTEHPALMEDLGLAEGQLGSVYRVIDRRGSGSVSVEEVMIGFLKMGRSTQNVDMLNVDFQQQKIMKEVVQLADSSNEAYAELARRMQKVVASVNKLELQFQRCASDLKERCDPETVADVVPELDDLALSAEGGQLANAADVADDLRRDLENRFQFDTRLVRLEARLQRAEEEFGFQAPEGGQRGQRRASGARQGGHADGRVGRGEVEEQPPGGAAAPAGEAEAGVLRELLLEEVVPWLQWQLAGLPPWRAAAGEAPAFSREGLPADGAAVRARLAAMEGPVSPEASKDVASLSPATAPHRPANAGPPGQPGRGARLPLASAFAGSLHAVPKAGLMACPDVEPPSRRPRAVPAAALASTGTSPYDS